MLRGNSRLQRAKKRDREQAIKAGFEHFAEESTSEDEVLNETECAFCREELFDESSEGEDDEADDEEEKGGRGRRGGGGGGGGARRRHLSSSRLRKGEKRKKSAKHGDGVCDEETRQILVRMNDPLRLIGKDMPDGEDILGPFWNHRRSCYSYAHRKCALWSPQVYQRHDRLVNVVLEMNRARSITCVTCKKGGASIGCMVDDCRRSYHLTCAAVSGCLLNQETYQMWCSRCSLQRTLDRVEEELVDHRQKPWMRVRVRQRAAKQLEVLVSRSKKEPLPQSDYHLMKTAFHTSIGRIYDKSVDAYQALTSTKPPLSTAKSAISTHEEGTASSVSGKRKVSTTLDRDRLARIRMKFVVSPEREEEDNDGRGGSAIPRTEGWSGIGGLSREVRQIKECVLLPLMYPELFAKHGVEPPRGVILYGPPGTGKTSLARALAESCTVVDESGEERKVTFFHHKAADLLSKFIGETEQQLRELFEAAKLCAPSIIFFDEVDALVPVRSSKQNQVHSSIVTTLLSLMDGLEDRGSVFVMAATNRVDAVDPALRRPGRFDREVYVGLPNREQRKEILRIHISPLVTDNPHLVEDAALDRLCEVTRGFSGADIKALCSEAIVSAVMRANPLVVDTKGATGRGGKAAEREGTQRQREADEEHEGNESGGAKVGVVHEIAVEEQDEERKEERDMEWVSRVSVDVALLEATAKRIGSSSSRASDLSCQRGSLSPGARYILQTDALKAEKVLLGDAFHQDAPNNSDMGEAAAGIVGGRVMLCGSDPSLNTSVATHLLECSALEASPVFDLGVASLSLQHEPEAYLCSCFREAASHTRGVLLLPSLDEWWRVAKPSLRASLLGCLRELPRFVSSGDRCQTVVIASSSITWTASACFDLSLPRTLFDFFSFSVSHVGDVSFASRVSLFSSILSDLVSSIKNDSANNNDSDNSNGDNDENIDVDDGDKGGKKVIRAASKKLALSCSGVSVQQVARRCTALIDLTSKTVRRTPPQDVSSRHELVSSIALSSWPMCN